MAASLTNQAPAFVSFSGLRAGSSGALHSQHAPGCVPGPLQAVCPRCHHCCPDGKTVPPVTGALWHYLRAETGMTDCTPHIQAQRA